MRKQRVKTTIEYVEGDIKVFVNDEPVHSYFMERENAETGEWVLFRHNNGTIVGPIDKDVYRHDLIERISIGHYDRIDKLTNQRTAQGTVKGTISCLRKN